MRVFSLLCLLFTFSAAPALAGPDRIALHFGSFHAGANEDFQEFNPGVFVSWERETILSIGVYQNSFDDVSIAATSAVPLTMGDGYRFDFFAGLAWYPDRGREFSVSVGDVVPLAGLRLTYGNAFVQLIPSNGKRVDAIISFGLTFPLGGNR